MAEPLLDLERLVAGIRWRRRIWATTALLGLLGGVLLTLLLPPQPTAVTRVLIVREDDQQSERQILMETDVAVFQTSQVADAALKKINANEPVADLLAAFKGVGLTPNVLEITVKAKSDSEAVRRAQALADVFIADHIKRTQDADEARAKALLDQRSQLVGTLDELNKSISSTTAQGAQLDALYTRRAGIGSKIQDLESRAEDARLGVPPVIVGTRIVDSPRALPTGLVRTALTNSVLGLVLGLGAGLALAAVLCATRDRPVLRRDIAAHLGVSIIAQLPDSPRGPRRMWRRSRHTRERKRAAATLARVVRDVPGSVSLLEIGCPQTTAALALDIAGQLAPERPVVIVDGLDGGHLSKTGRGHPVQIIDIAELPVSRPSPIPRPELYLGVGSVGPGRSWVDKHRLGLETVLVVRAGQATTLWLHTVARQLAQSGISTIGAVLVAPDPRDRSDGTLWDALHMVLRGRAPAGAAPSPGRRPAPSGNGKPVLEPYSTPNEVGIK